MQKHWILRIAAIIVSISLSACASNEVLFAKYQQLCEVRLVVKEKQVVVEAPQQESLVWSQIVLFGVDQHSLLPGEYQRLDNNLLVLNKYPDLKILLRSYADERGDMDYNFNLSQRRSQTVYDYLSDNGLSVDRIRQKAFGQESPVADYISTSDYQTNRRVEMILLDSRERPIAFSLDNPMPVSTSDEVIP